MFCSTTTVGNLPPSIPRINFHLGLTNRSSEIPNRSTENGSTSRLMCLRCLQLHPLRTNIGITKPPRCYNLYLCYSVSCTRRPVLEYYSKNYAVFLYNIFIRTSSTFLSPLLINYNNNYFPFCSITLIFQLLSNFPKQTGL